MKVRTSLEENKGIWNPEPSVLMSWKDGEDFGGERAQWSYAVLGIKNIGHMQANDLPFLLSSVLNFLVWY